MKKTIIINFDNEEQVLLRGLKEAYNLIPAHGLLLDDEQKAYGRVVGNAFSSVDASVTVAALIEASNLILRKTVENNIPSELSKGVVANQKAAMDRINEFYSFIREA